MVISVELSAAVASLPSPCRLSGALWLAAPVTHQRLIIKLRGEVGLLDLELEPYCADEDPAVWARRQWSRYGVDAVEEVAPDPASWVRVTRSGARHLAHGSTMLWGLELAADERTHPVMLLQLARDAHAGVLVPGVVTVDGCVALQSQHATRWSLIAA
jgi:hypothetical protein